MDTDPGKRRPGAAFVTPHGVSRDSYIHSGFKKGLILGIDLQDNKGRHTRWILVTISLKGNILRYSDRLFCCDSSVLDEPNHKMGSDHAVMPQ